ncbi:hypothetical protein HispidOSU_015493 [Sigmodon hispidus]
MADLSPALAPREGGPRPHRPSAPSPPPRSISGSEPEESKLSQHGQRHRAPCGAPGCAGDTLQGIALKYGVMMEQIKRANKLFTNDCIFLKKTLSIPILSEKPLLFNGLNSIDSPEKETVDSSFCQEEEPVVSGEEPSPPSPQDPDPEPAQPEEVSARDFLQRLDLQIKLSTQAAR